MKELAESWALAQGCADDWAWILKTAREADKVRTTIQAIFVSPFLLKRTPLGMRWTQQQRNDFLPQWHLFSMPEVLEKRLRFGEAINLFQPEEKEEAKALINNKVLRHLASKHISVMTAEQARALYNQKTVRDWHIIAQLALKWIPRSKEFEELPDWVQVGWEMAMEFSLEKIESAFIVKSVGRRRRRALPCLSRFVTGARARESVQPRKVTRPGYITPNEFISFGDIPSVYATLSLVAFEAEQHDTFGAYDNTDISRGLELYRSACIEAEWKAFSSARRMRGYHFAKDASFMAGVTRDTELRQVRASSRESNEICPTSLYVKSLEQMAADKQVVKAPPASKQEKRIAKEIEEAAANDKRFEEAKGVAIEFLESFSLSLDNLMQLLGSQNGGIPYLMGLGTPSMQEIWQEALVCAGKMANNPLYPIAEREHLRTVYVPWLDTKVTAPFWEFTLGKYSPRAFDTVFIATLTDTQFEHAWDFKQGAFCSGWLVGSDTEAYVSEIAGLGKFPVMQTNLGEISLWEWYYRNHAIGLKTYKKTADSRMRHLHALKLLGKYRENLPEGLEENMPRMFQRRNPINLLREIMNDSDSNA